MRTTLSFLIRNVALLQIASATALSTLPALAEPLDIPAMRAVYDSQSGDVRFEGLGDARGVGIARSPSVNLNPSGANRISPFTVAYEEEIGWIFLDGVAGGGFDGGNILPPGLTTELSQYFVQVGSQPIPIVSGNQAYTSIFKSAEELEALKYGAVGDTAPPVVFDPPAAPAPASETPVGPPTVVPPIDLPSIASPPPVEQPAIESPPFEPTFPLTHVWDLDRLSYQDGVVPGGELSTIWYDGPSYALVDLLTTPFRTDQGFNASTAIDFFSNHAATDGRMEVTTGDGQSLVLLQTTDVAHGVSGAGLVVEPTATATVVSDAKSRLASESQVPEPGGVALGFLGAAALVSLQRRRIHT